MLNWHSPETKNLARLRKGELEGLQWIFQTYSQQILNQCYRILLSRKQAEDMLQDVFLRLPHIIGEFRGESSLGTWLSEKAIVELDLKNVLGTYPVDKAAALKFAEKMADVDRKILLLKVETMSLLMGGLCKEQHANLLVLQEKWHEKRKAWKEEMQKDRMEGNGPRG